MTLSPEMAPQKKIAFISSFRCESLKLRENTSEKKRENNFAKSWIKYSGPSPMVLKV